MAELLQHWTSHLRAVFVLLQLTVTINITFLNTHHHVYGQTPLFRLMADEISGQRDNNLTVFLDLLQQMGQTKRPPTQEERTKATKLLKSQKLFKPQYQRITKPSPTRGVEAQTQNEHEIQMSQKLKRENFKIRASGGAHPRRLHKRAKKHFRQYLEQLSHCPLNYQWKDLGSSVWPRYIKETYCVRKSCSYPPGMYCSSSDRAMVKVTLLYWTCHALRVHARGVRARDVVDSCEWKLMHVNAISQCTCTCGGRG